MTRWPAAILLAVLLAGTVGFLVGGSYSRPEFVSPREGPPPVREIRIGGTLPLTGSFAPVAGVFDRMYRAWEELVNQRGGLYVRDLRARLPVKIIVYDDGSDAGTAVRLYERLITEDRVDVLIGPYSSTITLPLVPVVTKHGIPLIATTAGAPPIFNQGSDWVVTGIDLIGEWPRAYFQLLQSEGRARTIAIVATDEPYGRGVLAGTKDLAQQHGLRVVAAEVSPVGARDFTPIIIRFRQANADVVFVAMLAPDAATFVKQATEQGLRPREFHVPQLLRGFIESVGPQIANYITGEWYWMEGLAYDGVWGKQFWREVLRRSGIDPQDFPWAVNHYIGLEILAAAIEQAGGLDKPILLQALKDMSIMTVAGPIRFRNFGPFRGVGVLVPFPVQLQDGRFVVVWPPEARTGEHVYPAPNLGG